MKKTILIETASITGEAFFSLLRELENNCPNRVRRQSENKESLKAQCPINSAGLSSLFAFNWKLHTWLSPLNAFAIFNIYMLFTGREVRIGKNCARGLEYVLKTKGTVFPYTDRPRQVNNFFIFSQHLRVCRSILKGCQNARKFHWVRWQETVERM